LDYKQEEEATGSLKITGSPKGATVFIGGKKKGTVPATIKDLKPGDYEIRVEKEGFKGVEQKVTIISDKTIEIKVTLEGKSFAKSIGMKFVYIKPGSFMMGSPSGESGRDDDETRHRVTLTRGFYMQTTEVTQGQWKAVMGSNPSYFNGCGDNCPVEAVSWNDVQGFIKRLNEKEGKSKFRLPTEAQWEYACRADTITPFSFGNCLSTDQANYDGNYPLAGCSKGKYRKKTIRVGSFRPNARGLYDMHGNVWEWCQDWYGDYPSGTVSNPKGPASGSARVLRGGSWNFNARICRSADRDRSEPGYRNDNYGFRLVFF